MQQRALPRASGFTLIPTRWESDGVAVVNEELAGTILGHLLTPEATVDIYGTSYSTSKIVGSIREQRIAHQSADGSWKVGWFVVATDRLNFLDSVATGRVPHAQPFRKEAARQAAEVLKPRMGHPGIMRPVFGVPAEVGEVWLSVEDASYILKALAKAGDLSAAQASGPMALDGAGLYLLRYPTVNSKSCSRVTVRVVRDMPPAIGVNLGGFAISHQGDADGDIAMVFSPVGDVEWPTTAPEILTFPKLRLGGKGLRLRDLSAPRLPSLDSTCGQFVRGQCVGMLTYYTWQITMVATHRCEELGMSRHEAFCSALDLSTPLIEGVMDARKSADGSSSALRVFNTLSRCMGGKCSIEQLSRTLTELMTREHVDQVQRFTLDQIALLGKILAQARTESDEPGTFCNITGFLSAIPALESLLVGSAKPNKLDSWMGLDDPFSAALADLYGV